MATEARKQGKARFVVLTCFERASFPSAFLCILLLVSVVLAPPPPRILKGRLRPHMPLSSHPYLCPCRDRSSTPSSFFLPMYHAFKSHAAPVAPMAATLAYLLLLFRFISIPTHNFAPV
jgi:hypothetical protein